MTSKTEGHRDELAPMIAALLPSKQYWVNPLGVSWPRFSFEELPIVVQKLVQLESFCGFLPIREGSKAPMVPYKDKPHSSLLAALKKEPAALAIRSRNLLTLDFDSENALKYAADRGINLLDPAWITERTDHFKSKANFFVSDKKLLELPNGKIKRTVNYLGTNLDVFLSNDSYIIFLGEHEDGNGHYFSRKGHDVTALAPPPKEVWDLVLEIAHQEKPAPSNSYSSTTSKRLNPCPICSRSERLWCSETEDGAIWCMNGSTFSAEKSHGPLTITQVVNTSSGKYAVASISAPCTTFKPHQERRTYRPHRTTRPKRNTRRALNVRTK